MNITAALYGALAADGTLTGYLGTFNSAPAIFSTDPPPADYDLTGGHMIVLPAPNADEPDDTLSTLGRDVVRNIRVYASKRDGDGDIVHSEAALETTALRVRTLLHHAALAITGAQTLVCTVSGPTGAPTTSADVSGRLLSVRIKAQET